MWDKDKIEWGREGEREREPLQRKRSDYNIVHGSGSVCACVCVCVCVCVWILNWGRVE